MTTDKGEETEEQRKGRVRNIGEVVEAQLTVRSLPIPEDPGSNSIKGNLLSIVGRKDENKEKEAANGNIHRQRRNMQSQGKEEVMN